MQRNFLAQIQRDKYEKCSSLWKPQKLQKQRTDTFRDIRCCVMVPVRAPSGPWGRQQRLPALAGQEKHRRLEKVQMPASHLWSSCRSSCDPDVLPGLSTTEQNNLQLGQSQSTQNKRTHFKDINSSCVLTL